MPIPDYQSLMLPLLRQVADNKIYRFKDIVDRLAEEFNLNEQELNELLPSGQAFLFSNRVGWARTYLKKAGLIDSPKRGAVAITSRGLKVLKKKLDKIDNAFLKQFPEFILFQNYKREEEQTIVNHEVNSKTEEQTPEETIENAYQTIRQTLALDLLDTVRKLSPMFFERTAVRLRMRGKQSVKPATKV